MLFCIVVSVFSDSYPYSSLVITSSCFSCVVELLLKSRTLGACTGVGGFFEGSLRSSVCGDGVDGVVGGEEDEGGGVEGDR